MTTIHPNDLTYYGYKAGGPLYIVCEAQWIDKNTIKLGL